MSPYNIQPLNGGSQLKDNRWSFRSGDFLYAMLAGTGLGIFAVWVVWYSLESRFSILSLGLVGSCIIAILCGSAVGYRSVKNGYGKGYTLLLSGFAGLYFSLLQIIPLAAIGRSVTSPFINDTVTFLIPVIGIACSIPLVMLGTYLYMGFASSRGMDAKAKITICGIELSDEKWPVKVSAIIIAAVAGVGAGFLTSIVLLLFQVIATRFYWKLIDGIVYHVTYEIPLDYSTFYCLCIVILCSLIVAHHFLTKGYRPVIVLSLCALSGIFTALFQPNFGSTIQYLFGHPFSGFDAGRHLADIAISLPLAALSAYILIRLKAGGLPAPKRKRLLAIAIIVLLMLMSSPVLVIGASSELGLIESRPYIALDPLQQVQRTANDTITITNVRDHTFLNTGLNEYLDKDLSYIIFINGIEVSNATEISEKKLDMHIYPEYGLRGEPGQNVTITGPFVSDVNKTRVYIGLYNNPYEMEGDLVYTGGGWV